MGTSTTLKLNEALKARIVALAAEAGTSPHAFMLEALEAQTAIAERRREFVRAALNAEEEVARYGVVYSADEVHRYLQLRLAGKRTRRPKPTQR